MNITWHALCFFSTLFIDNHTCYFTNNITAYDDIQQFNGWRSKYNKTYENETYMSHHFNNWLDNRDFVNHYNSVYDEFTLELNEFADIHHGNWKILCPGLF